MFLRNFVDLRLKTMVTAALLALNCSLSANEIIRIMAANTTSGNAQSYPTDNLGPVGGLSGPGNRIFQGLDPDIVLVQEMNVGVGASKNTPATYRAWVDGNFGTTFSYRVETGKQLPNGIISRFPILESGVWEDAQIDNREFIWAKIDIPGDKYLWVIAVHLSSGGGSSTRQRQALALRGKILEIIPAADYLVLGGDLNTDSRGEQCVTTLSTVIATGSPYPVDQNGVGGTNASRQKPYDWVIPDADLNARSTPLIIENRTFPNGLVYDSRVTSPYVFRPTPILADDSGAPSMQHMAVMRAFLIPTESGPTIAIAADSSSTETDAELFEIVRGTSVNLSVLGADAAGEATLNYTWSVTSGAVSSVAFSMNETNVAKSTAANFLATGSYTLTATVQNSFGLTSTSSVRVRLVQNVTSIVVNPPTAMVAVNSTQVFAAILQDQFTQPMPGIFTWSVTGGGNVDSNGLFTATTAGGPFSVSASHGIFTASSGISVIPAAASVTLNAASLNQTYDGDPKVVAVATNPAGLAFSILYNGSALPPIASGIYTINAAITDPNFQGSATGLLNIAADPWALWKNINFSSAERTLGLADDSMDPDVDGFTNLAEYALGTDPRAFSPSVSYLLDDAGLTLFFSRPASLPGIIYSAEASSDLVNWVQVPLVVNVVGSFESVSATDPSATRRFIRLSFERQ